MIQSNNVMNLDRLNCNITIETTMFFSDFHIWILSNHFSHFICWLDTCLRSILSFPNHDNRWNPFSSGLIVWLVLSINFWSINPSNFTTFEQHILTNHIVFNMNIKPTNNKDGSIIMNRDRILDKYTSFIQSIDQSIQLFSISVNDIEIEKWTYSFLYCGFICFLNPLSMIP